MDVSGHSFWTWSLEVYARPGVEQILLDLQDRLGLDVNLLLFACWIAMNRRRPLTVGECERLVAATRDWRDNVTVPLRGIRRFMKAEHGMAGAQMFREKVKRLELEAERVAQQTLVGMLEGSGSFGGTSIGRVEIALAGLEAYLVAENIATTERDHTLLSTLARACCV